MKLKTKNEIVNEKIIKWKQQFVKENGRWKVVTKRLVMMYMSCA